MLLLLPLLLDSVVNVDVVVDVDVDVGVAEAVDRCGQQLKLFVNLFDLVVLVVMLFLIFVILVDNDV